MVFIAVLPINVHILQDITHSLKLVKKRNILLWKRIQTIIT